jgi:hypothetical protein
LFLLLLLSQRNWLQSSVVPAATAALWLRRQQGAIFSCWRSVLVLLYWQGTRYKRRIILCFLN